MADNLEAYTLAEVIDKAKAVDHISAAAQASAARRGLYHLSRVVDIEEHDKQRRTTQLASVELHGVVHPRHEAKTVAEWLGDLAADSSPASLNPSGLYPSLKDRMTGKGMSTKSDVIKPVLQPVTNSSVGASSGARSPRTSMSGRALTSKFPSTSARQSMSGGESLKSAVSPLSVLARLDRERFSSSGAERRSSYNGGGTGLGPQDPSKAFAGDVRPGSHVAPRERLSSNGAPAAPSKPELDPTAGSPTALVPTIGGQAQALAMAKPGIRQAAGWDRFSDCAGGPKEHRHSITGGPSREATPTNPFRTRARQSEGGGPVRRAAPADAPDLVASSALGRVLAPTRACDLPPMRMSCAGRLEGDLSSPVSPRGGATAAGQSKMWPGIASVRGDTGNTGGYLASRS